MTIPPTHISLIDSYVVNIVDQVATYLGEQLNTIPCKNHVHSILRTGTGIKITYEQTMSLQEYHDLRSNVLSIFIMKEVIQHPSLSYEQKLEIATRVYDEVTEYEKTDTRNNMILIMEDYAKVQTDEVVEG